MRIIQAAADEVVQKMWTTEDMWYIYNHIGRKDGHNGSSYSRKGFEDMLNEYKHQKGNGKVHNI